MFHEESETDISDENEDTIGSEGNKGVRSLSDTNRDQRVWQSIDSKEKIVDSEETEEYYGNRSNAKRKNCIEIFEVNRNNDESNQKYSNSEQTMQCNRKGSSILKKDEVQGAPLIKCDSKGCTYSTCSDFFLNLHKICGHSKKIECDVCHVTCNGISGFRKHIEDKHPKQYSDKRLKHKSSVQSHQLSQHSEQLKDMPLLVCQQTGCEFSTKSPITYKQHIRCNHKNFVCDFEGCTYRSHSSNLMYSHKKKHEDITKVKHYKCHYPECGHLSRFKSNLNVHLKMHITNLTVKEFGCRWTGCDQTFPTKKQLCGHMKVHKVDKPFRCDWPGCERTYSTDANMRIHLRTHSEDKDSQTKRFRCHWPGCEWTGKQKLQFEYHMSGHQGLMPFECHWPGCEQRFRTKQQLIYHTNRHNNVRPFRCKWSDCDKAFYDHTSLRQHSALHFGHRFNAKT